MDCLTEIYEPEWPGHDQIPVKSQALQIYYEDLCHKLNDQVTIPLSTYLSQFSEIKVRTIDCYYFILSFSCVTSPTHPSENNVITKQAKHHQRWASSV